MSELKIPVMQTIGIEIVGRTDGAHTHVDQLYISGSYAPVKITEMQRERLESIIEQIVERKK